MKKLLAIVFSVLFVCGLLTSCGGPNYSDLAIVDLGLEKEYFGIAFRSGSDMTRKVEDLTVQLISEGKFVADPETVIAEDKRFAKRTQTATQTTENIKTKNLFTLFFINIGRED